VIIVIKFANIPEELYNILD
jgi:Ion transport protein